MSSGAPKRGQDRINTYGILLIGLVSSVLLWVSVVALQAYYNRTAGDLEVQRSAMLKSREAGGLKAGQQAELQDSRYVDAKRGLVTIPIDSAKQLVLRDLRDRKDSLVPAVGPHDLPTVPAVWGRPPDLPAAPAGGAPAGEGAAPAAPAPPSGPAAGTPTPAPQPTPGAAPAAGTPAQPPPTKTP
jgi:hypothetical protein